MLVVQRLKVVAFIFSAAALGIWFGSLYDSYHAPLHQGSLETKRIRNYYFLPPMSLWYVMFHFAVGDTPNAQRLVVFGSFVISFCVFFHQLTVTMSNCFGLEGINTFTHPTCVHRQYPDVMTYDTAWIGYMVAFFFYFLAIICYYLIAEDTARVQREREEEEALEKSLEKKE